MMRWGEGANGGRGCGTIDLRGIGRVEKRGGGMGIFDEYVDGLEGLQRGQVRVADFLIYVTGSLVYGGFCWFEVFRVESGIVKLKVSGVEGSV